MATPNVLVESVGHFHWHEVKGHHLSAPVTPLPSQGIGLFGVFLDYQPLHRQAGIHDHEAGHYKLSR